MVHRVRVKAFPIMGRNVVWYVPAHLVCKLGEVNVSRVIERLPIGPYLVKNLSNIS